MCPPEASPLGEILGSVCNPSEPPRKRRFDQSAGPAARRVPLSRPSWRPVAACRGLVASALPPACGVGCPLPWRARVAGPFPHRRPGSVPPIFPVVPEPRSLDINQPRAHKVMLWFGLLPAHAPGLAYPVWTVGSRTRKSCITSGLLLACVAPGAEGTAYTALREVCGFW